jgi:hypothetical protein
VGPTPAVASAEAPAPTRSRPWDFAFGAGAGWDDNIDFLVPDGPSAAALVPRAALARTLEWPRGRVRALASGLWRHYPDQADLRRHQADVVLDARYRSSEGTTWRASASGGLGDTVSSRILAAQGVALPRVRTRSLTGAVGLSTRLGARTSLRVDGRYYRTDFDSAGLVDGDSARASLGLERRVRSRSTAALEYSVEDVFSDQTGRSYLTHFGSVQWVRVLSRRGALLLEAGASYTPQAARVGLERKESFFGGGSFTRQAGRSSLVMFVRREVTPAFGLAVSRLEVRAGLGAALPVGRASRLRLLAAYVRPDRLPARDPVHAASADISVALSRRIGRSAEVSAEGRYRGAGASSALAATRAYQAGVFVTVFSPGGRFLIGR